MFRNLLCGLVILLCSTIVRADELKTYNSEMIDALTFLSSLPEEERPFVLFLTTFAVPITEKLSITDPENPSQHKTISLKEAMIPLMNFTVHSLSGGNVVRRITPVSDTLFYVDIRDYDWTEEAIEKVSFEDPYFKEPWVDHDVYTALRLEAGNNILRADWFVAHTMDVIKQVDTEKKVLLYYELLYAKTGVPKNIKEFQDRWFANVDVAIKNKTAKGTIVDYGKSIVALHNRQLLRIRTETGYYWGTQDVKNQENKRDFIENLVAFLHGENDFDAGEFITTNKLGLQVYLLANAKGDRIEFADNAVAVDSTKGMDARVSTPRSCIVCHSEGIIPVSNALRDLLNLGVNLTYGQKQDALDIQGFFLDDIDTLVLDDQNIYKKAVKKITGLESVDMVKIFQTFMRWYEQPLDLAQASLEVGKSIDAVKLRLSITTRGRVGSILKGRVIPRQDWEEQNRGAFTEAMLLIYDLEGQRRLLEIPNQTVEKSKVLQKTPVYIIVSPAPMWSAKTPVLNEKKEQIVIPIGTKVTAINIVDGWLRIKYNNKEGFISGSLVKRVE